MKNHEEMNRCFYCGAENPNPNTFVIGAKSKPSTDFTMVYGTGKMACGICYPAAAKEGSDRIERHIQEYNRRASAPDSHLEDAFETQSEDPKEGQS